MTITICAEFMRSPRWRHGGFTGPARKLAASSTSTSPVSILILQGRHLSSKPLQSHFLLELRGLAAAVGRNLELRPCASLRELVGSLRAARRRRSEFVLLDPGELAPQALAEPEALRQALDELPSAYIEVHDASATTLDDRLRAHAPPLATIVINGDLAMSYRIALGIALRRLSR